MVRQALTCKVTLENPENLTSVCTFLILFCKDIFPEVLKRRICLKSRGYLVSDLIYFLYPCDSNVCFRGDIERRNKMLASHC